MSASDQIVLGSFLGGQLPHVPVPHVPLPHFPTPHLPNIALPDLSKLDPTAAARRELERARQEAMRGLHRFEPNDILRNVDRALQQRIGREMNRNGIRYDPRTGVADLRETAMGRDLAHWIGNLAQGNHREGRLEEFSFNGKTQALTIRLYARHRQSWGRIIPGSGPVDLYSVTQTALFHYDFHKGNGDFAIDLGPLAPRINSKTYERLSKGDLIGVVEASAPQAVGNAIHFERKNEYAARVASYNSRFGAGNVYFASKEFVDWATPETIGRYVVNGVVSAGASVYPQIMNDARDRAQQELPHLTQWLQRHGVSQADSVARDLLAGRQPRLPNLRFEITAVRYSARERPLNVVATPWRDVNHAAFVIVWSH